jgi:hypothetical protein
MPTTPEEDPELATVQGGPEGAPAASPGAFSVIRAVLDPYAFRILVAMHDRECTAFDLSRGLGIPIVACYRRLRTLEQLRVIGASRMIMSSGHRIRLYRTHLRSAQIRFEDGQLVATIELARPGAEGSPEALLVEAIDRGPARRKRSRAPRNLGYAGAALEFVPHRDEGALDPGEAGG